MESPILVGNFPEKWISVVDGFKSKYRVWEALERPRPKNLSFWRCAYKHMLNSIRVGQAVTVPSMSFLRLPLYQIEPHRLLTGEQVWNRSHSAAMLCYKAQFISQALRIGC
jgi:hypothetical protein